MRILPTLLYSNLQFYSINKQVLSQQKSAYSARIEAKPKCNKRIYQINRQRVIQILSGQFLNPTRHGRRKKHGLALSRDLI